MLGISDTLGLILAFLTLSLVGCIMCWHEEYEKRKKLEEELQDLEPGREFDD